MTLKNSKLGEIVLQFYFLFITAGGLYALISIITIPGESSDTFLKISNLRLIFIFLVILVISTSTLLFIKSQLNPAWLKKILEKVHIHLENRRLTGIILASSLILIGNSVNLLVGYSNITEPVTAAYFLRLSPILVWLVILSIQTIAGIYLIQYGFKLVPLKKYKRTIIATIICIAGIFLTWIWICITGYGITTIDEGVGWHVLGTPILGTQVLLTLSITILFLIFQHSRTEKKDRNQWFEFIKSDWFLVLLLWITAFCMWTAQPLMSNWFASEPRPPNFEYYPNSDASVYDITAQNLLLGEGFKTRGSPFTLRPLFAAFLAGLHALTSPDYESIISLQVAALAFIPPILYLVAKNLHSRSAGIFTALLLILRETNAIKLGNTISEAHAKLLMPFLPTALGILIFIYLFSLWLQNPIKRKQLPMFLGGLTGLFMLIRPEFIMLLFFVGLAALFQLRKNPRLWFRGIILATASLIITLIPWVWRNYQLTGTIFIDSPHYRLDFITKRFREVPIGFTFAPILPKESNIEPPIITIEVSENQDLPEQPPNNHALEPEPTSQILDPLLSQTQNYAEDVLAFVKENPDTVSNFIIHHFMNNVVQTVLQLPVSYSITASTLKFASHKSFNQFWLDCCSLVDYERRFPFWPKWDGTLPDTSFIPVTLNLLFIAIGISSAWIHKKFIGLIPLFGGFGYYIINSLVRNSGGRYTVPVNWIGILYFCIGIIQVLNWGIASIGKKSKSGSNNDKLEPLDNPITFPILSYSNLFLGIGFFVLGGILPILEKAIPREYENSKIESRFSELIDVEESFLNSSEIDLITSFMNNQGRFITGLALYPRHHKPYQMGSVWNYYHDRPYSHLDFYLSSPYDTGVVLPIEEPPKNFQNAIDVAVFGCPIEDYYQALVVIIYSDDGKPENVIWRSPIASLTTCQ